MSGQVTIHEQQVLGQMLTHPACIDAATDVLVGSMFRDHRHELIFDAIDRQASTGQPADTIGVADALGDDLGTCGGLVYLHELADAAVGTSQSSTLWHAGKVRDAATVRQIRSIGDQLVALADLDGDAVETLDAARATLDRLARQDDTDLDNAQAVAAAIEALDRPIGTRTPWRALNEGISGWSPGFLYVAGARPGIGKTVLGICALLDMAKRGHQAVMVSLEMPKTDLYQRMLCAIGGVDAERMQHRALFEADYQRLSQAAGDIAALPLVVDDRSALSLAQIRAKIRTAQRTAPVGLVVVDYLSLVKPPRDAPRNDRRVQVDAIAQGLKELAKDLTVPVLALAQLNRGIEGRADKAPTMADLRESGGIEAAADVVLLMHRDVHETPDVLDVTVAKNRHGPQTRFDLDFVGKHFRIEDQQWTPTNALGA